MKQDRLLYRGGLIVSAFVFAFFFSSSTAKATNYFSWGVESPANNATSLGVTGPFWLSPWHGGTIQDCTISHSGSCSMKMTVIGQDGGNQQNGPDVNDIVGMPFTSQAVSGSGSIYYRSWVRYATNFNWGAAGVANVKTSRAQNGTTLSTQRFFTGHMRSDGFYMAECDFVSGYGGGCLTQSGQPNNDYQIKIPYNVQGKADGLWHEYIWRVKPNTGSLSNAEMEVFVDGVSVGTLTGWRLTTQNSTWYEAWGGWMAVPYWQMNGNASVGGQVWVDDVSTDDAFNSIYSGTPAPAFTLSANPTSITSGQSSALTWSAVTNATSCTASGGAFTGTKSTSGGTQSVSPTSTTTYTLSCTGAGGTTNQTATVTVGTSGGGSECASDWKTTHPMWIWCDDFETDKSSLHVDHNGWGTSLVRSSGNGYNGTTSLRSTFPSASGSASNGGDFMVTFGASPVTPKIDPADNTKYQELYWRTYIKTQPSWQPGSGMKFTRATSFTASNWSQAMIAHWWGGGTPENSLSVDPASGVCRGGVYPAGSPSCTNNTVITNGWNDFNGLYWLGLNTGTNNIFGSASANTWQCVEGYVKLNTPGSSDGVQTLWIDGVQDTTKTGLNFVGTYSTYGINIFRLENYMNQGVSQSEYRDWDNLVLSTQRVGCTVGGGGGGDTTPPTWPTGTTFAANATSQSSITVTWSAATDDVGVTGYIVERCQGTGCSNFSQIDTPTTSPFIDSGLTANTFYNYHVRARDAAGNLSGWSNVVGATIQAGTPATVAYLQGAGTTDTATAVFPSNNTAGNTIIAAISWGSNATPTCSDSQGNTYTVATNTYDSTNNQSLGVCYASNIKAGANTFTLTVGGASSTRILIHEYSGIASSSPVDVTKTNIANATTATNNVTSTAATTTQNNDLIFGAVMDDMGTTSITAGTNFTQRHSVNNKDLASQDYLQPTAGSIASTQTFGTAHRYLAHMVAFKTTATTSFTSCNTVTTGNFSQAAYNSYGAPFDAFQTSTNLINASCNSADPNTIQTTLGVPGDTTRIVYTKGFYYAGSAWTQYTGTCTGALNGDWCQGSVSATITDPNISVASATAPAYLVGMTCSVQGGGWKCGCRDTTCGNFYWMIQGAGL